MARGGQPASVGRLSASAVMQDLAADQLTDDSDPRLGVRGASPRQHVPPAKFLGGCARFYSFPLFFLF